MLDYILTVEIFCTTNLITLLFVKKKINESVQYKAALAVTGPIQGTSQEKTLDKLGLETIKSRRWLRRLCCMYKIINIGIPKYLTDRIPKCKIDYDIRNGNKPFF